MDLATLGTRGSVYSLTKANLIQYKELSLLINGVLVMRNSFFKHIKILRGRFFFAVFKIETDKIVIFN